MTMRCCYFLSYSTKPAFISLSPVGPLIAASLPHFTPHQTLTIIALLAIVSSVRFDRSISAPLAATCHSRLPSPVMHPRSSPSYSSQQTWFKLPAFSAAFIEKHIEDGDKIILPPSVLDAIMQRYTLSLPNPLIFEINNNATHRTSHCGVLEFSSPEVAAYLPHWMMQNLLCEEGKELRMRIKSLPRGLEVALRPVQYAFSLLPTPRETLEYALRKFTTLTVGDTVRIEGGGKVWQVRVESVQPVVCAPAAVCVINTDMSVEFLESVEGPRREDEGEEAKLGEAVAGEVEAEAYHYYRVRVDDRECGVKVECRAAEGEPDVYVSTTHSKPSAVACDFKSTARQRDVLVQPPEGGGGRSTAWLYVSVHAYKQKAKYSLLITTFIPAASTSSSLSASTASPLLSSARNTRSSSPTSARDEQVQPPDTTYCSNCHLFIPNKQYNLHSIQCPRLVVYCPQCQSTVRKADWPLHTHCPECNAVMSKDELEKHVDLMHRSVTCECGAKVAVEALATHKADECELRLDVCHYCQMQLPHRSMAEHIAYEMARSVPCDKCGQNVSRRRMAIHLATAHGINPSLRPGDRSSMGAKTGSTPPATASALSASAASGEGSGMHEEEEMARVMRESRHAAGLTGEEEDDDEVLARVLRESEREAAPNGRAIAAVRGEDMMSDGLTAEEDEAEAATEFDDTLDDANDEDSWDDTHDTSTTASSTAAVAPAVEETTGGGRTTGASANVSGGRRGREPSMCPYCASEFDDYEALIGHMAVCDQMED